MDFYIAPEDELLLHNYHTLPSECKKYWKKRYDLFSRFDEGVYMTSELWYSVTPEALAIFIARLVKELLPNARKILDVCCGGGGNAIQFAHYFPSVGAVDILPNNLQCTVHNAGIYGVFDRIWTQLGDWNELQNKTDWIPYGIRMKNKELKNEMFDFVFCSPPWGGPLYKKSGQFDLEQMKPFNLETLCGQMRQFSSSFGFLLPRQLNLDQIRDVTEKLKLGFCRTIYLSNDGREIGLLALFGNAMMKEVDIDLLIY